MREISCPLCGEPTYVGETDSGLDVHCQQCAGVFAAPQESRTPAAVPAAPTGPDFSGIETAVFLSEKPPASSRALRVCPVCGAENELGSRFCSDCEEPFDARGQSGTTPRAAVVRSLSQVFGEAWTIYKRGFAVYMGAWFVTAVLSTGLAYLVAWVMTESGIRLSEAGWGVMASCVQLFWSLYWQLGLSRLALNLCRQDSPTLSDALVGVYRLIHAVAAMISIWTVFGTVIGVAVGVLALAAPSTAVVVTVTVGLYLLLFPLVLAVQLGVGFSLMDRSLDVGVFGSLRLTFAMIGRNFIGVYVLCFCGAIALLAANLALIFPLIFVVPYLFLVFTVTYLKASGQASSVVVPVRRGARSEQPVVIPADLE